MCIVYLQFKVRVLNKCTLPLCYTSLSEVRRFKLIMDLRRILNVVTERKRGLCDGRVAYNIESTPPPRTDDDDVGRYR